MENKFKAGDKVKVIKGRIDYLVEGHIHKVSSIDDDLVVLVEHPDEFWHYSRFELVKPEVNQPESKVEFKYNDKVYQGVFREDCSGCAFEYNDYNCLHGNLALFSQNGFKCSDPDMIFLEKKALEQKGQLKVNEQIIHCNKKSMHDTYSTTWVLTESDKGQKYVDVQYCVCHPDDQYNKKVGVQLAKSKSKVTMMKSEVPNYVRSTLKDNKRWYDYPCMSQIYLAIIHLIK